jgi:hypothetical protein
MSDYYQITANPDAVALTGFLIMFVLSYLLSKTSLCSSPVLKPLPVRREPRFYQWYEAADGGTSSAAQEMVRDHRRHRRIYYS